MNPNARSRRWLLWLIFALLAAAVLLRLSDLHHLWQAVVEANRTWLLVAAILQVAYYFIYIRMHDVGFRTVGVNFRLGDLTRTLFSAMSIHVALPGSGTALFIREGNEQPGSSGARTTAGLILIRFFDYLTFLVVLLIGLTILGLHHNLRWFEILASVILIGVVGLQTYLLAQGRNGGQLRRWLSLARRLINRLGRVFGRDELLAADWSEHQAADFELAAQSARQRRSEMRQGLSIGLVSHLVDILSLWAVFFAFGQTISFASVTAIFSIAILLWIVSPSPQGIGFVEGMMALVISSLGVPVGLAILISLTFRGLTFWLPFVLGLFLIKRTKLFQEDAPSPQYWRLRLAAWFTSLLGLINILSAALPKFARHMNNLSEWVPLHTQYQSRLTTFLAGAALLYLASNLGRRKWSAWLITEIALFATTVANLLKGPDIGEAILAAALFGWLWRWRAEFHARSDPPAFWQGIWVFASSFVAVSIYGTIGLTLDRHNFANHVDYDQAWRQSVAMFFQYRNPGNWPVTEFGHFFADSIYLIGLITLALSLYLCLRPVWQREPASSTERARAKKIVDRFGATALAPLALLPDKSYFFTRSGKSVIAYIAHGHFAVALGDPIGPPHGRAAAISQFRAFCLSKGWSAVFYSVPESSLPLYRQQRQSRLGIGREAIVDTTNFCLEGSARKNLRNTVAKVTRQGYRVEFWSPPLSERQLDALDSVSGGWLADKHGAEKRFSLGWFDRELLRHDTVSVIVDETAEVVGFVNILTVPEARLAVIDLMRYNSRAESGVMEALLAQTMIWAGQNGWRQLSLGVSPLANAAPRTSGDRLLAVAYKYFNDFYNFQGLHRFKNKFDPTWESRYLIYPNAADLPAVWSAVLIANNGDGAWSKIVSGFVARRAARLGLSYRRQG